MSDASFELRAHNVVAEQLNSLACIDSVKTSLKNLRIIQNHSMTLKAAISLA